MNLPDSTAYQRLPRFDGGRALGGAILILLAVVSTMECVLAVRGYHPGLADSYPLWERQRQRVDRLGEKALVLVGNSRMQIDVDLGILRRESGREPVQLAIGGGSFLPVLKDLAADPAMRGTVLVNFEATDLAGKVDAADAASAYEVRYAGARHMDLIDFQSSEDWLSDRLHANLRSYADGATPLDSLLLRILSRESLPQYASMQPDREQTLDFGLLPLPRGYLVRAAHDFGEPLLFMPGTTDAQMEEIIRTKIAGLSAVDNGAFLGRLPALAQMARAITARGGRLIFVEFPRGGYLRQIDDRRFPRRQFWDRFIAAVPARSVNFEDLPALSSLACPDGSHLDAADRPRFTQALVDAVDIRGHARP